MTQQLFSAALPGLLGERCKLARYCALAFALVEQPPLLVRSSEGVLRLPLSDWLSARLHLADLSEQPLLISGSM